MAMPKSRKGTVTPENKREAAALMELYRAAEPNLKERGLMKQGDVGLAYDIGKQTAVSGFLNGETALSLKAAAGFAQAIGCGIDEFSPRLADEARRLATFATKRPPGVEPPEPVMPARALVPSPGYMRLPILAEAAGGHGRLPPEDGEVVRQVDVLEAWAREKFGASRKTIKVLTARGYSMQGMIEHGDVLFVELCTVFKDDGIYVISVDGLIRVKRLKLRIADGKLSIESNDGSLPEVVSKEEVGGRVHIQGIVLAAWKLKLLYE